MKSWILVADSARARLFESGAKHGELMEVAAYVNPEAQIKPSELGHDRPPRVHESMSAVRHAKEPHTDPHDKSAQKFAHSLAEILDQGRTGNKYMRLLLVAPARFLGQLNQELNAQVTKLVTQTVSKDYSRADAAEIRAMLNAH